MRLLDQTFNQGHHFGQGKKQALQDHILTVIKGRRLAGVAVAMGVDKTLLSLRDMARLLPEDQLPRAVTMRWSN